jgi:hypothetical protein
MPAFRSGGPRYAFSAVEKAAGAMERAFASMGLYCTVSASRISASRYVYVRLPPGAEGSDPDDPVVLKIRVSDHFDRHHDSDYSVYADEKASAVTGQGAWHDAVAWVAGRAGLPLPSSVRAVRTRLEAARTREQELRRQAERRMAAIAEAEAGIQVLVAAWDPDRWQQACAKQGKAGREARRLYRRVAEAVLGIPASYGEERLRWWAERAVHDVGPVESGLRAPGP